MTRTHELPDRTPSFTQPLIQLYEASATLLVGGTILSVNFQ